ncbi:transglutaminase family protein [Pseudoalteromonas ruthenica]|uniref:transglutaminase family protein n=1 Tax=Pseudoalteromonas ruthenica TaxID=151081 RepID=UPI00124685E6|nr:transglutaminaseTgpA domain-containing protein [Pseudoalteromonas ruthenica]
MMLSFVSTVLSVIYIGIFTLIGAELPSLMLSLLLLLCLWNLLLANKSLTRPGALATNLLAAACLGVLFVSVSYDESVLLFVSMLLQAAILKLLQAKTPKQLSTVIVLTFFSLSTVFLYQQSLYSSILVAIFYVCLLASLAALHGARTPKRAYFQALGSFAMAIPIAALLLLFIPKVPAFWKLPGAGGAKTGLNERIDPFNIANLAKSDDLVFRAEFPGQLPAPPYYWRALNHEEFDGKAWIKAQRPPRPRTDIDWQSYSAQATLYLESSANRWLYALQDSVSPSQKVENLRGGLLKRKESAASSFQYPLLYRPVQASVLTNYQSRLNRLLPTDGNPQARALARQLSQSTNTANQFASRLMGFYEQQGFSYTLTPTPITDDNFLDVFLTQTKRGFCGHYASTSAFIMRAAGIPARVVSGYLGGEQSEQGNYLRVYQYDAHAWVEYYDGNQWQRFDATSVVAPERLNGSLSQVQELQQEFMDNLDVGLLQLSHIEALNWLRLTLEELDYSWTKWVLGFDQQKQKSVLKDLLGNQIAQYSMVLALCVVALVLLGLLLLGSRKQQQSMSFSAKWLNRLFLYADKQALLSTQNSTPKQKLAQLATHCPGAATPLARIEQLYTLAAYKQRPLTKAQKKDLVKQVKKAIKIIG